MHKQINPRREGDRVLVSVRIDVADFDAINAMAAERDVTFVETLRSILSSTANDYNPKEKPQ